MMKLLSVALVMLFTFISCQLPSEKTQERYEEIQDSLSVVKVASIKNAYSELTNTYEGFHSPNAINRLVAIENEYYSDYEEGYSKYYGTVWAQVNDTASYFQLMRERGIKPDSMHCTIYAVEGLKAGMGKNFQKLQKLHQQHWGKREYAGWSLGYLLTKHFSWKAYLIISENSHEYEHCMKSYRSNQTYPVWRQPDIPLEQVFLIERDSVQIDSLLSKHEFGWGFSEQGYHTWLTRFTTLKECFWAGAPSKLDSGYIKDLFLETPFRGYYDYSSHVVIFPPKLGR